MTDEKPIKHLCPHLKTNQDGAVNNLFATVEIEPATYLCYCEYCWSRSEAVIIRDIVADSKSGAIYRPTFLANIVEGQL